MFTRRPIVSLLTAAMMFRSGRCRCLRTTFHRPITLRGTHFFVFQLLKRSSSYKYSGILSSRKLNSGEEQIINCQSIFSSKAMLDNSKDIILEINQLNLELKKKLEMVSKWRAECAQLQLEFLKLYVPLCLNICEFLKEVTNKNND